jgi:uncharacterized protein (TIGR04141 family)
MAEKIQVSFYQIENDFLFDKSSQKHSINKVVEHLTNEKFKRQKLQPLYEKKYKNYTIEVYYKTKPSEKDWKDFLKKIVKEGEDILNEDGFNTESYVILIYNKKNCFATTGGYGHFTIKNMVFNDFGLEILSTFMQKEDRRLKAVRQNSLAGNNLGSITYFRNNINILENDNFGSLYSELNFLFDKSKLMSTFGLSQKEIKSDVLCVAKNSFTIKKSISFDEVISIIENCEKLLINKNRLTINKIKKINDKSKDKELNDEFFKCLFEDYQNTTNIFNVEISSNDFDNFYQMNRWELTLGKLQKIEGEELLTNLNIILDKLEKNIEKDTFKELINNAELKVYNSENLIAQGKLKNYFFTELNFNGKNYFLLNSYWYEIEQNFIDELNEKVRYFIDSYKYEKNDLSEIKDIEGILLRKYLEKDEVKGKNANPISEGDYNISYLDEANTLVFDKITSSNIEICDFLKWDDNNVYFYHVKWGFDHSMRDLCSQIYTSARQLKEDYTKKDFKFLKDLFNSLKNLNATTHNNSRVKEQLKDLDENTFLKNLQKKPIFVLVILGGRDIKGELGGIQVSTYAKISINDLFTRMKDLNFELKITQKLLKKITKKR